MGEVKVSVVTVCFNAFALIEKTILSVVNQTYANVEYIIVDGGSTDGTIDVINKYNDRITKLISEPDKGIYDAMNKGIKMASGQWISFMNAGDSFYDNHTLSLVFSRIIDTDVIYGDVRVINSFGEYNLAAQPLDTMSHGEINFCHQSSFVKTDIMKSYLFDTKYRVCADYDFFYKIWKEGRCFYHIPQILSVYDISGGSFAIKHYSRAKKEQLQVVGIKGIKYFLQIKKYWLKTVFNEIVLTFLGRNFVENRIKHSLEVNPFVTAMSWK